MSASDSPARSARPPLSIVLLTLTLAALTFGFLVPVRAGAEAGFWSRLWDAAHLPLIGVLALVLHLAVPNRTPGTAAHYLISFAMAGVFAGAIEWLQPFMGRTGSVVDLLDGLAGAGIVLAGIWAWQRGRSAAWRATHAVLAAAVALAAAWPAVIESRGRHWRQQHFPALGEFEDESELHLWLPQGGTPGQPTTRALSRLQAASGRQSLEVQTAAGDYAGVSYAAGDRDWSGFRALALDVFNPREPFTIFVRVDDSGDSSNFGDRFERDYEVGHGWTRIRVPSRTLIHAPANRRLDLRAIRRVAVFTGEAQPARQFFLDHVHLIARED